MASEQAPGVEGVTIERNVPCRLRDGVTLYADVYRPGSGPHPVLLMREPYGKDTAQGGSGYAHPSVWASRGYVTVVQDCRGRFRSEGDFYPFASEGPDGYDTVEWAARLPGADGRVGMYGFSYPGATQLLAAAERPPSLVAIAPAMTSARFSEGWTSNGGALALAFAASWALGLAWDGARRQGDTGAMRELERAAGDPAWYRRLPLVDCAPLTRENAPYYFDWLEHPGDDGYWQALAADLSRIEVPALHVGGWYDIFVAGTMGAFAELEGRAGRQKLLVGPWTHGPWTPVGPGCDAGGPADWRVVDDWQLRWFDHWLKGRDTGVLAAPATAFVLGDGWRDFDGWPPPGSRPVDWYLRSGGRANSALGDGVLSPEPPGEEPADVFVYDPLAPVESRGGHSCCSDPPAPMGPTSQRVTESWRDVLVYTTGPLAASVTLAGDAEVTLFAATTALDTDFTARLCLVDPAGESVNLKEGIVRARYRRSLARPEALVPGAVESYRISLGPLAVRVPAGHRLRLQVSSSDFPHWDRNLNTGGRPGLEGPERAVVATQAVLHDRARPSRLSLSVLP